jgi:hypothetical protein
MKADSEQYINQLERENERMADELGIAIAVIDECHALIETGRNINRQRPNPQRGRGMKDERRKHR